MKRALLIVVLLLVALGVVLGQRSGRRGGGWGRWGGPYESAKTAREIPQHGYETPTWTNTPGFEADTLAFTRIQREHSPYSRGGPWWTDAPDSDLNLSFRLQQMTSMKVDPDGVFLRLTPRGYLLCDEIAGYLMLS